MYSVFIQWNENTSNYRRFDGGLEVVSTYNPIEFLSSGNAVLRLWLDSHYDKYTYTNEGHLYDNNAKEVVVLGHDFNSTEPASVDFGDGTIYVAEVQS